MLEAKASRVSRKSARHGGVAVDAAKGLEDGGRALVDEQSVVFAGAKQRCGLSNRRIVFGPAAKDGLQRCVAEREATERAGRPRPPPRSERLRFGIRVDPFVEKRPAHFIRSDEPVEEIGRASCRERV